jgi:hypothetical protein
VPQAPRWINSAPDNIISDFAEVIVSKDVEVKRFHVAVRAGDQSVAKALAGEYNLIEYRPISYYGVRVGHQRFPITCTPASTRRIRANARKAGAGSYYEFDYATQEAVIKKPESQVPLLDWLTSHASPLVPGSDHGTSGKTDSRI